MQDAVATMGMILPDDAGGRDAVHVAVFSAFSKEILFPGQEVRIWKLGEPDVEVEARGTGDGPLGITDPFLANRINPGERFWVYLYPRTITALSHRWSHPSFETTATTYAPPNEKLASEEWLRAFTATADCPGYEEVLGAAARIADDMNDAWDPQYMHFDGRDAHGEIPDEFWDHVAVVLGRPIQGERAKYFSCAC